VLLQQSLKVRILLAAIGGIFGPLLIYSFLGWAVWSNQPWLHRILGHHRFRDWYVAYARVASALLLSDRDGDGFCDGLELFLHKDPRNASDHPPIFMQLEDGGISVGVSWDTFAGGLSTRDALFARPGQRLPVHGFIYIDGVVGLVPRHLQVQITPPSFAQVAQPGGAPVTGPLRVNMAPDGSVAFDLLAAPDVTTTEEGSPKYLTASNAATGDNFASFQIRRIFATGEPIPLSTSPAPVEPEGKDSLGPWWPAKSIPLQMPFIFAAKANGETYVIEAARNQPDAQWFPVGSYRWPPVIARQSLNPNARNAYTGPLKFRVVPTRFWPAPVADRTSAASPAN